MGDSGASLQFWQGIAAVVGAAFGGFFLAVGRRAGGLPARAAPSDEKPSGDALQREILVAIRENTEETRSLRADWQAKRDADEARRREQRDGVDEQMDDIRHALRIGRTGQNEIKVLLRELIDRMPFRVPASTLEPGAE